MLQKQQMWNYDKYNERFFLSTWPLSLAPSLAVRGGCEACLLTPYNTFNVFVRAANKTWLMSSSLLLKIRVALQSGDRARAINLGQNEQSNNHSSEMKSTYINTPALRGEYKHRATGHEAGPIYPHVCGSGRWRCLWRRSLEKMFSGRARWDQSIFWGGCTEGIQHQVTWVAACL